MKWAVVTQFWPVREQLYRGHSAYQTIRRLIGKVDVETFAPQAKYPKRLLPSHRPWAHTNADFQPGDVPTTYFDYPAVPVLSRYINGRVCAHRLEPFIRASKPDLILNYWVYPDGYAAVRVGKKLNIPVVTVAIGTDLNKPLTGVLRSLTCWTLRNSDMVVTVSKKLAERAIALGTPASNVVPILNGCDTRIFYPADRLLVRDVLRLSREEELVLYVGRLDVLKGLLELVRACSILKQVRPNLRLVMVGEGPAKLKIEVLAEELNFRERLSIVPPCSSSQVAKWMQAADVFVLPSYAEGCPNVVVEALNCGTPVVASDVGGVPELVDCDRAILIPPKDFAALSKAIVEALDRPWDQALIARRSRRSWDDKASELLQVCEKLTRVRQNSIEPTYTVPPSCLPAFKKTRSQIGD